jgi:hypothetical protein
MAMDARRVDRVLVVKQQAAKEPVEG